MSARGLCLGAALLAALATMAPGCVTARPAAAELFDAAALRREVSDWDGPREGTVWLRRAITVRVDVARGRSAATSRIRHHLVRVRFGEGADVPLLVEGPADGRVTVASARVLAPAGARAVAPLRLGPAGAAVTTVDPDLAAWEVSFPPLAPGELLEVVVDVAVEGTLVSDGRWLGAPGGPTADLLVRYDVDSSVDAGVQVRDSRLQPVVARQAGLTVMAIHATDVPALGPLPRGEGHVRFVARSASARGHTQRFATSWPHVATPYERDALAASEGFRLNHRAPMTPTGAGRAAAVEAFEWVRDRIQRRDALDAGWADGRALPNRVTTNDLQATDKAHLLHWVLDAAGVPHRLAVARSSHYPTLDPGFPVPGAFDRLLVWLPEGEAWLDPACGECAAGQVRPQLRGGQGLLLPVGGERPRPLPAD